MPIFHWMLLKPIFSQIGKDNVDVFSGQTLFELQFLRLNAVDAAVFPG